MCTLLLAYHVVPGFPLVVASNRDERLDRPAAAPTTFNVNGIEVLAPKDLEEGGTWIGVNAHGVFAGLTNRAGFERDPRRHSRGHLVLDALGHTRAEGALRHFRSMAADRYNPFHLVVADPNQAVIVWTDQKSINSKPLTSGLHVVTERSFGAADNPRADTVLRQAEELSQSGRWTNDSLVQILSYRRDGAFSDVEVSLPQHNYGTRSSALIWLSDTPNTSRFFFAPGPPSSAGFDDYSTVLKRLAKG